MNREMIAMELLKVSKSLIADYGDVEFFLNTFDIFKVSDNNTSSTTMMLKGFVEDALNEVVDRKELRAKITNRLKRNQRLMKLMEDEGITFREPGQWANRVYGREV